jgi:hypothetical protein
MPPGEQAGSPRTTAGPTRTTAGSPRTIAGSPAPWMLALALAAPLALAYAILAPPAADLAAATYRSELFARVGFTLRDSGWYAAHGHWLPGYSLFSPALGALLGPHVLLALSALAAGVLFALIAQRLFPPGAARLAALSFALGVSVGLLSGRVPYVLGVAVGLGAVLALLHGRLAAALALAALCSLASPVAGAFLALVAVTAALVGVLAREGGEGEGGRRSPSTPQGLALAAAALAPIVALALAFPEGGWEPFDPEAFWPPFVGVVLIALALPRGTLSARGRLLVRAGAALYALALLGAFLLRTPVGGNSARLGALLGAPLLAGVLWSGRWRVALAALAPVLLYWQLVTPIQDYQAVANDPSVKAAYYAPLRAELRALTGGRPTIVEVPLTGAHWEAAELAGHDGIALARGWERQLDTRYAALFYRPGLSAAAYGAWLRENRVAYVALADATPDYSSPAEDRLVARGLPYLREVWRAAHWRLFAFTG